MTKVVKNSLVRCELCDAHARAVVELGELNAKAFKRQRELEHIMLEIQRKIKRAQTSLEEIAQHVNAVR